MSKNLWEDEDQDAFRDNPVQLGDNGQWQPVPSEAPPPSPRQVRAPAPQQQPVVDQEDEEFLEQVLAPDEDEENYEEVLSDANLRLEQGTLYKLILNHDLFKGVEADDRAIKNVQKEIRKFAKERMEVMLGMRSEAPVAQTFVSSPFNDLEVEILKKLASKATNGATETAEAQQYAEVIREPKKPNTLNSIGTGKARAKPVTVAKPAQKLQAKPATPVARKQPSAKVAQILAEEGVTMEEIERQYGNTQAALNKPLEQMTEQEILDRNRQITQRRGRAVDSPNKLPQPSYEQEEMLAAQRASQVSRGPGMDAILAKVKSMPINNT